MPNFALLDTPCKMRGEVGKISESTFRAIIYAPLHISYFRYVTPFRNQSASKPTGVENRGILHFLTTCNIRGEMGEMSVNFSCEA